MYSTDLNAHKLNLGFNRKLLLQTALGSSSTELNYCMYNIYGLMLTWDISTASAGLDFAILILSTHKFFFGAILLIAKNIKSSWGTWKRRVRNYEVILVLRYKTDEERSWVGPVSTWTNRMDFPNAFFCNIQSLFSFTFRFLVSFSRQFR